MASRLLPQADHQADNTHLFVLWGQLLVHDVALIDAPRVQGWSRIRTLILQFFVLSRIPITTFKTSVVSSQNEERHSQLGNSAFRYAARGRCCDRSRQDLDERCMRIDVPERDPFYRQFDVHCLPVERTNTSRCPGSLGEQVLPL